MKENHKKVREWLEKYKLTKIERKEDKIKKWGNWLKTKIPGLPIRSRPGDVKVYRERNKRFRRCLNRIQKTMERKFKLKASNSAFKHLAEAGTKSYSQSIRFEVFAAAKERDKAEGMPEECVAYEIEAEIEKFIVKGKEEKKAKENPKKIDLGYKKMANRLDPGFKRRLFMEEDES